MSQGAGEAFAGEPVRSLELVRGAMAEGLTTPGARLGDGLRGHAGARHGKVSGSPLRMVCPVTGTG
jgi:hypothetical protein